MESKLFFIIFLIVSSCTTESTAIITDFDYVKLTQTTNQLSTYYVKGTVKGMDFSYSTNDPLYANTIFGDTTTKISNGQRVKGIIFSIGDVSGYIPIWFYVESMTMTTHDFVQNIYVNQTFTLGPPLGVVNSGYTDALFHAVLQVNYNNQYGHQYRDFTCCTPTNTGILTITHVQNFSDHMDVTFDFKGDLYSTPAAGDILYFGNADIEMCVRINFD